MGWQLGLNPEAHKQYQGDPFVGRLIERRLEIARAIGRRALEPDSLEANIEFDDAVRAVGTVNTNLMRFGVDINQLFVLEPDDRAETGIDGRTSITDVA